MAARHRAAQVISGLHDLDAVLGGLLPGDNVVWVSTDPQLCTRVEQLLLGGTPTQDDAIYVTALRSESEVHEVFGKHVVIIDARDGSRFSEPVLLEQAIVTAATDGSARIVVDGLESFARRWGTNRAIGFFKRVCPGLFDLGSIAYWRASRARLGNAAVDDIRKSTQCVLELSGQHLRVIKAEGRPASAQGRLFRVSLEKGTIHLHTEPALGRLAEGLRRLRDERSLSQASLARLAKVSPSAVSQAEAGHRGLSLDTLLTLTGALGIGLDDLLGNQQRPDYVLARRDRALNMGVGRFLLDDPSAGLRVYLVNLAPGERGRPPVKHKGPELLLVAHGLVLADLGSSSPAVRAGDAILATKVPILSWSNLASVPSLVFWILRD